MAKGKGLPSTLRKHLKSKVPKKKHHWSWKRKVQEKETKWFEAVLAETRAELNHMEGAEQKAKTRLRKLERKNSEIKKGNRLAAMNIARIQLCIDAVLDLLDD
ncbi:PREDICTED: uncharacterized protein LOC18594818 isoform X2 [Theobroma cacao]|uniref:Uncharacterized protein LOC18594818 isoform X2 n=2 Tax=Theobroma cacao TaxID=3641 RepID=A0AB32WKB3_THECC|nr:PREDICTED: uncharacterized protein LOC18594818 isoform X2 [Theobroma cacao]EOY14049.1 Uncharacterized protein TCM_033195 [Theobroma cacao]